VIAAVSGPGLAVVVVLLILLIATGRSGDRR
jgi:hypothetical protein